LPSQVQTLDVPARPSTPAFTIDYTDEETNEPVQTTVEYNTDNNFATANSTGLGAVLSLNPGQNVYFRVKVTSSSFISNVQTLVVPSRPSAPGYTIDYSEETTAENVSSSVEYSSSASMAGAISGTNTKLTLTPGTDLYFRTKVTGSSFKGDIQHLVVSSRPAVTTYAIDYIAETTTETIPTTVEYSDQSDFSGALTGTGDKIVIVPGTDVYFRVKATASSFAGPSQFIDVAGRPSTPAYSVNYTQETTTEIVMNSIEYNADNDFSTPNQSGPGTFVILTPGTDLYFRVSPTVVSFSSEVQTLVVPARPTVTTYTIDYIAETTAESFESTDEYSSSYVFTDATSGTNAKLPLVPATLLYFRTKVTPSSFSGEVQILWVDARPALTNFSIDFLTETTDENVPDTVEYSTESDFSEAILGAGAQVSLDPGTDLYFRVQATTTSFAGNVQFLSVPSRPATPNYTISYSQETTNEAVINSIEYNTDNEFSTENSSGLGMVVVLTPGTNMYFRVRPALSSFASEVQTLVVPNRPGIPGYTIDFENETTVQNIAITDEYSIYSSMVSAVSGSGSKIQFTPGTDLYFRTKSTASSFAGEIQHLVVPLRPPTTTYQIDYITETTTDTVSSGDEYSLNPDMSGAVDGTGTELLITPGANLYFRTRITASSFASIVQILVVPPRANIPIVSLSDKNSPNAKFMKSTDGTGLQVTTNDGYEYSLNSGDLWEPIYSVITEVDATGLNNIIVHRAATAFSFKSLNTENLDSEGIPEVSAATQAVCNNESQSIVVQSSTDNGKLYVILDGEAQSTETELVAAVAAGKAASVDVILANTDYLIHADGLEPGDYYAYAVNEIGELSAKGSNLITIHESPEIDLGDDILECRDEMVSIDAGSGFSGYLWTPGNDDTESLDIDEAGTYSVRITDANGCTASDTVQVVFAEPYNKEKLCIVTVDMISGKNLVVWEKTEDVGTIGYHVYRESTIGKYDMIGEIMNPSLSVFKDTAVSPENRSYLYKITSIDTCGNESFLDSNAYHRPIHLNYVSTDEGVNLAWTDYKIEGISDLGDYLTSFEIYRGSDSTSLELLTTVGSINNYTDNSTEALSQKYYYRVAGVLKDPCYPSGGVDKKSGAGTYHHSLSNLDNNRYNSTSVGARDAAGQMIIYPNPMDNHATIRFSNPEHSEYRLTIRDISGRIILIQDNITEETIQISRNDLGAGYFFVELKGEKVFKGSMVVD
jgi:hypothetical protein